MNWQSGSKRNALYILVSGVLFFHVLRVSYAQQPSPKLPLQFHVSAGSDVPVFRLPGINVRQLLAEDSVQRQQGDKTLRFGLPVATNLDIWEEGQKVVLGDRISCRFRIYAPKAENINLIFSLFQLPDSGSLFLYNASRSELLGGYTREQHNPDHTFATFPVEGDELILEYNGPNEKIPGIVVSRVIHGYRNVKKDLRSFGDSGPCNINVACPLGNGWGDQASSVVLMLTASNSRYCTGALLNNTSNDGTPYILTANHCEPASTDIFMFNYKSPTCNNSNGQTNQTTQGCTIRARNARSDFCLVELNHPPQHYPVFLSGWDRSGTVPVNTTVIHHPSGDVKKISRDIHQAGTDSYLDAVVWHIGGYENGTTEPGSSGAPLFDSQKRIIGQLYGGDASCNHNFDDYYGKLSVSWEGQDPSGRLHDWLDPTSKKNSTLAGISYPFTRPVTDARLVQVQGFSDELCSVQPVVPTVTVKNMGTGNLSGLKIMSQLNNDPPRLTEQAVTLLPGHSADIVLHSEVLPFGTGQRYMVWLTGSSPDENPWNDTLVRRFSHSRGVLHRLLLTTDKYGEETSFRIINNEQVVMHEVTTDSLSDNTSYVFDFCLPPGCYTFRIEDGAKDGICCRYGFGSFSLRNQLNQSLAEGGNFEDEYVFDFCTDTTLSTGPAKIRENEIQLFPVPAQNKLTIQYKGFKGPLLLHLYDATGRLVYTHQLTAPNEDIDISGLPAGVYLGVFPGYGGGMRVVVGN